MTTQYKIPVLNGENKIPENRLDILPFHNAHFQVGTANFIGSQTVNVTFPVSFSTTPKVSMLPLADPITRYWVDNVSAGGFVAHVVNSQSLTFDWMAIQR